MAKTVGNLIADVLPRLVNAPKGISIYNAANSVLSLIYKKLMDRDSDLLATGNLFAILQSYDYMFALPSDFVAMIGKPAVTSAPDWVSTSAWIAGTVVSYDSITKTLIVNATSVNGSGTLSSWFVNIGVLPGQPIQQIDTSVSSITVPTVLPTNVTLVTDTADTLVPGMNVIISNIAIPNDDTLRSRINPTYLTSDENDSDLTWWNQYGTYGIYNADTFDMDIVPSKYQIVGTNFYIRPKPSAPIMITGRYKQKPSEFTSSLNIIPWNDLFYEVFREGVVRIILKSISIPESDPDFMLFVKREVDTIITARFKPMPKIRTYRENWI